MPFIRTADGVDLYCRDWGSGPPVLFVSSALFGCEMWHGQMEFLVERGLRCVGFDRRSHGRSDDPGRGYDYDTLADDLAVVIAQRDLRDVTLVGISMGGGEIVRYLSRHGAGRVARIVLIGAVLSFMLRTADNPDGIDAGAFDQMRAVLRADYPNWLAANIGPFVVPETSAAMREWLIDLARRTPLRAVIGCNHAVAETDFRAELPRISLPTLVIHGDADASVPLELTGRKTARMIPGSRLHVYEGAPHGLFVTHKDRLNADLLAFATAG